jgi:type IV secretory pathway VirB4 component
MESANSQDLVLLDEVRDDVLILKSGALCKIIMVGGVNFVLKSDEEKDTLIMQYQDFLNSLDFTLQILIHSRKINIEKYLTELEARKIAEPSGLLQNQISEYQAFISSFVADNAIMSKVFLVVVPFYPSVLSGTSAGVSSLLPFGKKNNEDQKKQDDVEKEAEFQKNSSSLQQRVDQVIDGLTTMGLQAEILGKEQLIELFYNFYNPESVEKEGIPTGNNT